MSPLMRLRSSRRYGDLLGHLYALGVISGACHSYGGGKPPEHRGHWRGRRPYVLGFQRERWGCLIKRHHVASDEERYGGLCGRCMPCPYCGETRWDHDCEVTT